MWLLLCLVFSSCYLTKHIVAQKIIYSANLFVLYSNVSWENNSNLIILFGFWQETGESKTLMNGHTKDICGPEESKTFLNGHTKDICGMAPNGHNWNVIKCEKNHKTCNSHVSETNKNNISLWAWGHFLAVVNGTKRREALLMSLVRAGRGRRW